jgi:glycosyltransferase involved in cell wall biosynthesis
VYAIARDNGFAEGNMHVSYIGTAVAENQLGHSSAAAGNGLKVVFPGVDIYHEEKGYPFLIRALADLNNVRAQKIDLVLTMKNEKQEWVRQKLSHFRSLEIIRGYTHADLPRILSGCHLGIVPVVWEDNLPQIAIEMVAHGVPVLASSYGGASELCGSGLFRFQGGNPDDFLAKLVHLLENPGDLNEYWKHHEGLVTMSEHWKELERYYGLQENADLDG